jgi:hypothetical protein
MKKPPLRLRQRLQALSLTPTAALLFLPLESSTQARRHEIEAKWTEALCAEWPQGFNAFGTLGSPTGNRKWRAWFYAKKTRPQKTQPPPTGPSNSQPPIPPTVPHQAIDLTEDRHRELVIE